MKLMKRLKNELLVLALFPALIVVFANTMGASLYDTVLIWVAITVAFLMYIVIRWAFFDTKERYGKRGDGMWPKSYND